MYYLSSAEAFRGLADIASGCGSRQGNRKCAARIGETVNRYVALMCLRDGPGQTEPQAGPGLRPTVIAAVKPFEYMRNII